MINETKETLIRKRKNKMEQHVVEMLHRKTEENGKKRRRGSFGKTETGGGYSI